MAALLTQGLAGTAVAREVGVSRGAVRHFVATGGKAAPAGRRPFFLREEEELLVRFVKVQALLGRWLTRTGFLRWVGEYLSCLSTQRQASARSYFGRSLTPGISLFRLFFGRWPALQMYRVSTLEQSHAENARPDVLAKWFAGLRLIYRDLNIVQPRQLWNRDETHVNARELLLEARSTIIGPRGLRKPEVVMATIGSGAAACTAAFSISPAGMDAPHFMVVAGSASGHAYVQVTEDGKERNVALASRLNDSAVVVRRDPPGFDRGVFDVWAQQFAAFAKSYYPEENKLLALDGEKVHLSAFGLLALVRAKVHVIAEPSKISHLIQALDNKSAYGSFQPAIRRQVCSRSGECVGLGCSFTVLNLMDCIKKAADHAFSPSHLAAAFAIVGMWPLDSKKVCLEEVNKGADPAAKDVDLQLLADRAVPAMRKDLKQPTIIQGTLSTAGRPVNLTAPDVISALEKLEEDKRVKAAAQEQGRREKAARVVAKKTTKAKRDAALEADRFEKAWRVACTDAVAEARHRLSWANPYPRKRKLQMAAARQRARFGVASD